LFGFLGKSGNVTAKIGKRRRKIGNESLWENVGGGRHSARKYLKTVFYQLSLQLRGSKKIIPWTLSGYWEGFEGGELKGSRKYVVK